MFGRFGRFAGASNDGEDGEKMIPQDEELTVGQFFEALSAAEYPDYILELTEKIQEWMNECMDGGGGKKLDPVTALFESEADPDLEGLFSRISFVEEHADLIPNNRRPEGREEAIVVNVGGGDLDGSMRIAVDYASIFNPEKCRRIWLLSDSFDLVDMSAYVAHLSKMSERGIMFRFILVSPWGWVEFPINRDGRKSQLILKGLQKAGSKKRDK